MCNYYIDQSASIMAWFTPDPVMVGICRGTCTFPNNICRGVEQRPGHLSIRLFSHLPNAIVGDGAIRGVQAKYKRHITPGTFPRPNIITTGTQINEGWQGSALHRESGECYFFTGLLRARAIPRGRPTMMQSTYGGNHQGQGNHWFQARLQLTPQTRHGQNAKNG